MSSFCLSSAPILRCVPLSRFQSIVVLLPTVLEVIFTSSLVFALWNSGHKRHLLLTAEGWIYLVLSILELLTHILESAQGNVNAFAGLDVTTGVASFLPLFFYCFFLYIYSDTELLPNAVSLPKKLGKVASLLLLILIPAIVGVNEIASFVGIERQLDSGNPPRVIIGFSSQSSWTLNVFFSSLSLALMTLFQAIVFMVTGFRLVVAVINQRRFDSLGQDAVHMVKGIGWMAAGMKLGAIESLIGFAGGGFGIVLTRRLLRFLARACLCIGVVKGVDEIEDFRAVRQEMSEAATTTKRPGYLQGNKRGIKALISNPRLSTFQHIATNRSSGHLLTNPTFDYNRADNIMAVKYPGTPEAHLRSLQEVAGIATFETIAGTPSPGKRRQRVTVYRQSNGAPTLLLRLSSADFPSPRMIEESITGRPRSWIPPAHRLQRSRSSDAPSSDNPFFTEKEIEAASTRGSGMTMPRPPFSNYEKGFRDSGTSQSIADSVAEIVIAPQRTMSQSSARARLYRATSVKSKPEQPASHPQDGLDGSANIGKSPREMEDNSSPKLLTPPAPDYRHQSDASIIDKFRVNSDFSYHSLPDTLQAVRELANEFPGPPLMYNGRPVLGNLPAVSAWQGSPVTPSFFSKSARSSILANAYGPSAKGGFNRASKVKGRRAGGKGDDEEGNLQGRYEPRPVIMPALPHPTPSPVDGPKIFISEENPPDDPAMERYLRPKPSFISTHTNKSIDPFDDSRSSSPSSPIVQDIINRPTLLRPHPRLDMSALQPAHPISVPSSPSESGVTPVSAYTVGTAGLSSTAVTSAADPFDELAVRTGSSSDIQKSGRWKYTSGMLLPAPPERAFAPGEGLPSTPVRFSAIGMGVPFPESRSHLSLGQASMASMNGGRRSPSRVVWKTQDEVEKADARERTEAEEQEEIDARGPTSLQRQISDPEEAHRRQESIDAAAHLLSNSIPWLKNPDIEEEERKLQQAITETSLVTRVPKISRVKTVGSVAMKSTPKHTRGPMRRSLRVEPIMIPPPSESFAHMLEATQEDDLTDTAPIQARAYS